MVLRIFDRVKQVTSSTGTGNITLGGTPNGFQSFSDVFTSGDTTYICIENGANWEVSRATYGVAGSGTLSRDTILDSSTGAAINLSGRSTVFCTVPAAKYAYLDSSNEVNLSLGGLSDATITSPATGNILSYNGSQWVNSVPDPGYSDEQAQDAIGGILGSGTDIVLSYNDSTPAITGSLTNTAVTPGSYTLASITVDQKGRVTAASSGSVDLSAYLTSAAAASTYVALAGTYANPDWITQLAWSKLTGIPSAVSNLSGVNTGDQDLSSYATTASVASTYVPLTRTLNGLALSSDQTFAVGTTGTDFAISSSGTIHTFNLPDASASARGLVTTGTQTFAGAKTFSSTLNVGGTASALQIEGYSLTRLLFANQAAQIGQGEGISVRSSNYYAWSSSGSNPGYGGQDLFLYRDAAGTLAQRNSTNSQTFRLYNTYSSTTSFENLQFKATGSAYQIGSAIGSAGGGNRPIQLGHSNGAGTFTVGASVETDGALLAARFCPTNSNSYGNGLVSTNPSGLGMFAHSHYFYSHGFWSGYSYIACFDLYSSREVPADNDMLRVNANLAASGGNLLRVNNAQSSGLGNLIKLTNYDTEVFSINNFGHISTTQRASTSGSPVLLTITGAAHTTLTASTEATDVNFNFARTVQFATGALTTQRAFRIQAPTYAFVAASTITTASTLSISGAPVAGTNATITNSYALNVESGASKLGTTGVLIDSTYSAYTWNTFGLTFEARQSVTPASVQSNSFFMYGKDGDASRGSGLWIGVTTQDAHFGWVENTGSVLTRTRICRDADYIVALRNSTNPFVFRVYNTYTSSTSGEWGEFNWATTSNVLRIGTNKGSAGGSARDVAITHGGAVVANFLSDRFYLGPIADSTTTGGNARGQYAVDLQFGTRSNANQVASGLCSALVGGGANRASGNYSACIGGNINTASGQHSTTIGDNNTASGYSSFAGSTLCTASGDHAFCFGYQSSATANRTVALGMYCNSSAELAMSTGLSAGSNRYAMYSRAAGAFAAGGDAQKVEFVLRNKTTNNSATTLFLNGSSLRLTVPSGKILFANVLVSGIKSDGSAAACYKRKVAIKNVSGTTSLVGSVETIGTDHEDNASTDVAITADDTNDALQINVTGITGETWRWVAVVEGLEIAYGS